MTFYIYNLCTHGKPSISKYGHFFLHAHVAQSRPNNRCELLAMTNDDLFIYVFRSSVYIYININKGI